MNKETWTKATLLITRLSLGWLMFYAGFSKIIDPAWSAKGYLLSAQTFTGFYAWLASPSVLPFVDFANKWSLLLLGISLISGKLVRISGMLGALLMFLYYIPVLAFPYVGHGFLIDEHIVYAGILLYLATQAPAFSLQVLKKPVR